MRSSVSKPPKKHYRAWSPAEIKQLKALARKKTPLGQIAQALDRTNWAVRNRASSEGISLRT